MGHLHLREKGKFLSAFHFCKCHPKNSKICERVAKQNTMESREKWEKVQHSEGRREGKRERQKEKGGKQ